jgi:hypothetical protein
LGKPLTGVKAAGYKDDHLPPHSTKVKNHCTYTFTPPHEFTQFIEKPLSLPVLRERDSRGSIYLSTGHVVSAVMSIMQGNEHLKIVAFITLLL